jgi:leader peptidase (prepilin peptidase) / N-methyltransferase
VRLALGGILVLAALAAGWPARELIRRLAVPAPEAEVPAGDVVTAGGTTPPAESAAPAERAAQTENTAPAERAAQTENTAPAERAAQTESTAPAERAAQTENTAPAERAAQTENTAPAERAAQTENTAPAERAAQTESTAPAERAAEPESTAPAEGVASPPRAVYVGLCAAVLFAALTARIGPGLVLAAYCWLAVTTVPLGWIDAAVHRLPDVLTGSAYAGTVLLLLAAAAHSGDWGSLLRAVGGGLALAAAYFALAIIRPAGMGLGDVKLSASLGTAMAWIGWGTLLAGTLAGLMLAACYGLALLAAHRATLKQHIPLGPFMVAGTFLILIAVGAGPHVH